MSILTLLTSDPGRFGGWGRHPGLTLTPLALAFMPGSASAQSFDLSGGDPLYLFGGAVMGAILVGLIGLRIIDRKNKKLADIEAATVRLQQTAAQFIQLLFAGPDPVYYWSRVTLTEAASPGLTELLQVNAGAPFDAIADMLVAEDAARLKDAVKRLRRAHQFFDMDVVSNDKRRFRVTGAPARIPDNGGTVLAHGVWFTGIMTGQTNELVEDGSALKREVARLRLLIDALPVPIWRRDADLKLTDCNEAYVQAVEAPSLAAAIVEDREIGAGVIPNAGKGLAKSASAHQESMTRHYHVVVNGDRRLLRITEQPLGNEEDPGMIGFAIDGTEVEELQYDLAQHVRTHAEVLENLSTAIAIFGPDTKLKFFNAAYLALLDLDEDWLWNEPSLLELLEKMREQRLLPEMVDFQSYRDNEVKKFTDLMEPEEDLLHLPDGKTLRRVTSPHPFGGLLYTLEDVTDKFAMERNYNTLIAVQRSTLDSLHEAVAVMGADGRLQLCNAAFADMWEIPQTLLEDSPHIAELIEASRHFWGRDDDWPDFKARMVGRITNHNGMNGKLARSDGSILEYAVTPLPDGGVMLTYMDVTDSARVEQALRDRYEALRTADQMKSDFIATVSGELVRPLDSILNEADTLIERRGGFTNRPLENIRSETRALLALVDDMRDLATLGSGQVALELDAVDPRKLLKSLEALTRARLLERNVSLRLYCAKGIGWMVVDERRLKQALFILVNNALRTAPSGSEVSITARRTKNIVTITLGAGKESPQLRLFDDIDPTEPGSAKAALGMSMVRAVMEVHGGELHMGEDGREITCALPAGEAGFD